MSRDKALLVVEDEPIVRTTLEYLLTDAGFAVQVAENGTQAIQMLSGQNCTIDGIVTDVRLGIGPDGWAVARRAREQCPEIPVIYVTGDSAHEWRVNGVPESILVQKPFVGRQITNALERVLR